MFRPFRVVCALAVSLIVVVSARADLKLPAIIGNNMVLQQGAPVNIWGTAAAKEHVAVTFAGKTQTAIADENGKWAVKFDAMPASSEGQEMIVRGSATVNPITLKNVLVGEVWICSGQSNMQFHLESAHNAAVEIPKANHPTMRLFTVTCKVATEPQADCQGEWVECTSATVPKFSAVAYFFGRDLLEAAKKPVGLIHTSWGGTPAQSWTSLEMLKSDPAMGPYVQKYEKYAAAAKPDSQTPSVLFNAMIQPLIPYTIAGAIWYQGEANAGESHLYHQLFSEMITDWRNRWGQGDFPFLFVQLANWQNRYDHPTDSAWARLREAQTQTLALPKTGMAVIIDIGQGSDIHPKNKAEVGHRLFLAAEHVAYGKDIVFSGPLYDSMTVEGDKMRVKFKNVGSGLTAGRAPSTQPVAANTPSDDPAIKSAGFAATNDPLVGFMIAGEEEYFVWADAKIDGDSVLVSSPEVKVPKYVRYAWADNPECNLYNKEGLPASPFRDDKLGAGMRPRPNK